MTHPIHVVERSLGDPDRLCPVLAGPALVRGNSLTIRLHEGERVVTAPARYLARIWEWCDGGRTLADVRANAAERKLGDRFVRLVDAMLEAGILVDAARSVLAAAEAARYPSTFGMAAAPQVWREVIAHLPDDLPSGTLPLPPAPGGPLTDLFSKRHSATEFVPTPLAPEDFAGVLHALYGMAITPGARRSVASAGAFYRLTATLCLLRPVGEWSAGVYRVHYARGHAGLERIADAPVFLARAFVQPLRVRNATFVVVLSCDLLPGTLKYRNRYFQYAFIEAGSALQNAALACAQSGVGWRMLGGFNEAGLAGMLQLGNELPLAAAVGGPERAANERMNATIEVRAGWVNSLSGAGFQTATASVRAPSGDWGRPCWGRDPDPLAALDRALAEAVERHAYRQARDVVCAAAEDLDRPWLPPDAFVRYARWQYKQDGFPWAPFDRKQQRLWTPARRLDGAEVLVPAELVFHRTALSPVHPSWLATHASSSGCASHRSIEAAFCSALLELVERDAFSRHWLAQRPGIGVLADSLPAAIAAEIDQLARAGVEVEVQCLDAGEVPAWLVLMQSATGRFTSVGASSGLDPDASLWSAFREAQTAALVRLDGSARRQVRPEDVLTPRDHADLYAQPRYFRKADALRTKQASANFHRLQSAWLRNADQVIDALRRHDPNREILHVDLSLEHPPSTWDGTPLRTVRALVPGLVPLVFGHGRMPFGMVTKPASGSRFPHPFP